MFHDVWSTMLYACVRVYFYLFSFTYNVWIDFMQINTTNDGQLCLISDFILNVVQHTSNNIKPIEEFFFSALIISTIGT